MQASLKLALVAALYGLYLASYAVLGPEVFGAENYFWHEGLIVAAALVTASWAARRTERVLAGFLRLLSPALAALLISSIAYDPDHPRLVLGSAEGAVQVWAIAYALFLFLWICAWGYLTIKTWRLGLHSALTAAVFALLMLGLVGIYASFYLPELATHGEGQILELHTAQGRLEAVHAVLELGAVVAGLAGILVGVPPALVALLIGMAVLAASDVVYTTPHLETSAFVEPVWTLGLFILWGALLTVPRSGEMAGAVRVRRSGLSGVLLLLSMGSVLIAVTIGELLSGRPGLRSFFLILFSVLLVVAMVWLTGRFDGAVAYLRGYGRKLLRPPLEGVEWREERPALRGILDSTGLGEYLDGQRQAAEMLRGDVLFLGPERLNRPVEPPSRHPRVRAFLVMPYSLDWSDAVHHCLRRACRDAGVVPLRGDDLYTPTDILDDIWRGIYGADFVIADITGRNPNVLYELGMAHTLAKPVLIVSRNAEDIPIDLASRRILLYDQQAEGWEDALRERVSQAVRSILEEYGLAAPPEDGAAG